VKVWVILAFIAIAGAAAPPASPVVVATGVAEEATAANSQPKLIRDKPGTIYLVFVKPIDGKDQVFLASSDDQGHRWRAEAVTHSSGGSRYPTLALGPNGTLHVAWTQYAGGIGSVYYVRFDGQRRTVPTRLSEGTAYAGIPALATTSQGQPHIVWYGIRAQAPTVQTRHGSIYEILYTTARTSQWAPPEVISPGVPDSINPTLGIDSQDRLHSAWYQYDLRAYQVRHTSRDQTWSLPVQVSHGEDASAVAMALDHTNDVVYLVWERHETSGTRIYFAERTRQWSEQQPLSAAGEHAANPSIAVDDHGTVYVAWVNAGILYLTRRTTNWRGVDRIQVDGSSDHPILSSNGSNVDLVWTQQVGADRRLMYASLAGGELASTPSPVWPVIFLISIAGFLILTLWQWRKRQGVGWGSFGSHR